MKFFTKNALYASMLAATVGLSACGGSDGSDGTNGTDGTDGSNGTSAYQTWLDAGNTGTEADFLTSLAAGTPFDLSILHINDHHSHLEADSVDLTIGSSEYSVASGGFPRVVSAFKRLEANAQSNNVLKLHAGDAITGTLYYTLFQGEADAAMMNQVCFDAFALGNHEFDASDAGLKTFLDFLNPSSNATCPTTPVLAANVAPQEGTPLYPSGGEMMIQPYVVKEFNGEKVGIIGIDIASKTQNSSSPLDTTQFLDETTTAQQYIDELEADGVNKIILLTHYQYVNDVELAKNLDGVDIIVGGDSHTLLGNFDQYGLNSSGNYPTKVSDKAGSEVCIVQAWQYAQIVGELNVTFDGKGEVTDCHGTPHLLVEAGADSEIDGVAMTADQINAANISFMNSDALMLTYDDTKTTTLLKQYSDEVDVLAQEKIATAADNLCLERIPGQGRSSICSAEETKPHGGDIQQSVTYAFYNMAKRADIAIQNAGGVRIDVPAGDITVETAYTLLPFANTLTEIEMTGTEIKQVLEEAVKNALDVNGSTGSYPYAAGLRWDIDLSKDFGNRLSNLEYKARDTDTWVTFDQTASYVVVTNSYTAGGKDGYLTFGQIADDKKVDTFLDYAQSFADYAKQVVTVSRLPYSEYSTQNFTDEVGNTFTSKR